MAHQKINFQGWNSALSRTLKPALPGTSRTFIARQVKRGKALAGVIGNTAIVLRFESSELVVVAAAGQGLLKAAETIISYARENGCGSIRFHTQRKGLIRHLKKYPFVLVDDTHGEWVYRMTL